MRFVSNNRTMMRCPAFLLHSALLCAVLVAACSGSAQQQQQQAPRGGGRGGEQVVPVAVATVIQKSMPIDIRVIGTAEPYSTVALHAQITGQLTSVTFKEGDDVRKGQVLFELDRRPLEAALQQAEANLQRDIAQAANARSQAQRYQDLADRGIATKEQLDTSRTGAAALDATVEADRAAVENAKVQLQYATISAPIAGRTGALMVHGGNLVRANDTTPLVVINQVSPIFVSFGIPEQRLPELKRYMARGPLSVEARPPSDEGPASHGRITFVDNNVDQTTGTIRIKGTFANDDRRLWPGQFVNVAVALTNDPKAIVVPSAAIQPSQQGAYAFIVKPDKTVEFRTVVVARTAGEETVIKEGLKPGDTVVTDGHLRLVPGSRVSVKGGDAPKSESTKDVS
jgi:membrane fusion protein, multidrug efflux system